MLYTKKMLLLLLIVSVVANAQQTKTLNLMPVPKTMNLQSGDFSLSSDFTIGISTNKADTILLKAVNRFYQTLSKKTGLAFSQGYIKFKDTSPEATLKVQIDQTIAPTIGVDESYSLTVSANQILLKAPTTVGALHGLQTVIQLVQKKGSGFSIPYVVINDTPRFVWRGLMVDVSRHFIPLNVLERNIDAMAAVKMNVLHLHLTDDQGFRIESKTFPQLHRKGSNNDYYTQAQMKGLIGYARDRGIEIVPEFDMPGHSKSWFAGYPELASAPGPYEPGTPINMRESKSKDPMALMQFFMSQPMPVMDPTKESTYAFLDKFMAEMAALFPSRYVHIGADENNGVAWKQNPAIAAFMKKNNMPDPHTLQAYFVKRVEKILAKHHKQTIGWEELFSTDLPKNVTVQVWQNATYMGKAMSNGNPMLLSKGFYLDIFMPAYIHYNNPDLPAGNTALEKALKGGEAAQWTEIADMNNIDTRMWPRAAAIAERLWSPTEVNDIDDMYRRLFAVSAQLDAEGLQHVNAYERTLRLYAPGDDRNALKTLTDVLAPIKGYKKLFAMMLKPENVVNQTAPLMEVSDFIPVDAETKWKFRAAVKSYLQQKDEASEKVINGYLHRWQHNDDALAGIWDNSTALKRVREHSKQLALVAEIGMQAMQQIKAGTPASEEWTNKSTAVLKTASGVYGETTLDIIQEIESLTKRQMVSLPSTYSVF